MLGALAAGARGFSSWIDFDDGMVGTFATDRSASGNVQGLLYLLRTAAQTAIRNPQCGADFNEDRIVDFFDYLDFVGALSGSSAAADFNDDGVVDFFDYLDFVDAFSSGC